MVNMAFKYSNGSQLKRNPGATCEISSGTLITHTMDLSIGFDVIRYAIPFSENLLSRLPTLRKETLAQHKRKIEKNIK